MAPRETLVVWRPSQQREQRSLMKIVGCDFHPSYQQIAVFDSNTGEGEERQLQHRSEEVEQFYGQLESPALIGMESVGNAQWFVSLVESLGHQLWVGDAAKI